MKPGNGEHPPRDPHQLDGLDTYPVAQVEAFVERIDELESENKGLRARVAELEARCKRMEEAGDEMCEALYTPEPPRCMCHRSPPCDDCVNYALARDVKQKWLQAKEAKP